MLVIVVIASLTCSHALHPSFWWIAVPLAVQFVGTLGVLVLGIWQICRGPCRWLAAGATCAGMLPALFSAAYLVFLVDFASSRNHTPNLLTRSADAAVVMLGEPFARWQYPWRQEGQRAVMWSMVPDGDVQQLAALDAHILRMEHSLEREFSAKVYWVRGPVCGLEGVYLLGWVLGSEPAVPADDSDGLNVIDRHEAAHFVLDEAVPRGEDVASVLHEGWAELHSGRQQVERNRKEFLAARAEGKLLSLRELTGPNWYYNSDGPIYVQGCALVDYLLRQFGPQKFLALCNTCTQATFAEDVQRTLGIRLEDLDAVYQRE